MATYSSILAWKIPWAEEPGGLHSMSLQRVGYDWACTHTCLSFTWNLSHLPGVLLWLPIFRRAMNTHMFYKLLQMLQSWIRTETMQVVWNYLSLPIIPGVMVKTCLLHSDLLTCFLGRHQAACLRLPRSRWVTKPLLVFLPLWWFLLFLWKRALLYPAFKYLHSSMFHLSSSSKPIFQHEVILPYP